MHQRRIITPPRLEFYLAGLLVVGVALLLHAESTPGVLDRHGKVRGRDFLQFYLAGRIATEGDVSRLYDQNYFGLAQLTVAPVDERNPRYYSLYPPTIAWLFQPLGHLPYAQAVVIWWMVLFALLVVEIPILYRFIHPRASAPAEAAHPIPTEPELDELDWQDPDPNDSKVSAQWRRITLLALAVFYPVFVSILNGQLSPVLLGVLLLGLAIQQRGRLVIAGIVLSLLALKPQFAAGIAAWLFLRRDWRTIGGMLAGLGMQVAIVGGSLGFDVWRDYVHSLPVYSRLATLFQFTPDYEHSVSGIVANLLGRNQLGIARAIHAVVALAAAAQLWRVVRASQSHHRQDLGSCAGNLRTEQSAAVLFTLLATPHLLVYDLIVLLFPIAVLWSAERRSDCDSATLRDGLVLYSAAMLAPAYVVTGFSIVPVALFWVLLHHGSVCISAWQQQQ